MGCNRGTLFIAIAFISPSFSLQTPCNLSQPRGLSVLLQSKQAGPVPPSGSSPCSHIPGTGICVNEMNYAGPFVHPPPPYPGSAINSAAASIAGETNKQDPIS
ncbi:hypothetical protein PVL29_006071 [Vitis rotundifolia]|uniref:Uncharacterized protein n=1 Tax=Vitis rotundifolia TaxID=103349 RepID=A0AA39A629_VITRO|nr:hypothetical protein PVL29_006071 [Vitis rotundifolia]